MLLTLAADTPSPAPTGTPVLLPAPAPCFQAAGASLCKQVHRWTHSDWLAQSSDWLIERPARILAIAAVAVIINRLAYRAIDRLCQRAGSVAVTATITRGRLGQEAAAKERRRQRSATMASVLQSVAAGVIYSIALLMSLAELTFNIGPLIASAGILGVAIGFGAQTLVKDFLSGVFMILEDQFGVGDEVGLSIVDIGDTVGIVESVGLRVTKVRDRDGIVWYVRNGEILRVGNHTQHRGRVTPGTD